MVPGFFHQHQEWMHSFHKRRLGSTFQAPSDEKNRHQDDMKYWANYYRDLFWSPVGRSPQMVVVKSKGPIPPRMPLNQVY